MRRMVHGDFKPGEICPIDGQFSCRTCARFSRQSIIAMTASGTFPECTGCKERGALEIDTVWRRTA